MDLATVPERYLEFGDPSIAWSIHDVDVSILFCHADKSVKKCYARKGAGAVEAVARTRRRGSSEQAHSALSCISIALNSFSLAIRLYG